jgi:dihydroxyacetone kinase-like protein
LIVQKIVGAAAEQGASLAQLKALGDQVNRRTRSMGVALTSCTVPAAGKPTFTLGEDEMEIGVGIHGEPGRRRVKLSSADTIADEMVGAIVKDLAPSAGAEALLFVNGFGGTPAMELYLVVGSALRVLKGKGVSVSRYLTESYVTSLEMAGCSITVSLLDHALRSCGTRPCTRRRCAGEPDRYRSTARRDLIAGRQVPVVQRNRAGLHDPILRYGRQRRHGGL